MDKLLLICNRSCISGNFLFNKHELIMANNNKKKVVKTVNVKLGRQTPIPQNTTTPKTDTEVKSNQKKQNDD